MCLTAMWQTFGMKLGDCSLSLQPGSDDNDSVQKVPRYFAAIRAESPLVQLHADEQLEKEDNK